jgi:hypothetical protein
MRKRGTPRKHGSKYWASTDVSCRINAATTAQLNLMALAGNQNGDIKFDGFMNYD